MAFRTHKALCLIEDATARLLTDIDDRLGVLAQALAVVGRGSADPTCAVEAASALTAYLKLRRAAWTPEVHAVPLVRLIALTSGLPAQVRADLSALPAATIFPGPVARIVLNLLLLGAESLPAGGSVTLAGAANDLFVRIAGPAAAWPTGMSICLANEADATSALGESKTMQMGLTALLAHAAGIRLSFVISAADQLDPFILRLGH